MYEKFCLLFCILSMNFQISKQELCDIGGYNISNSSTPQNAQNICKAYSFQFNNEICYYVEQNHTCLNIPQNSSLLKNDNNYKFAEISNNCGISGFFEPLNPDDCKGIPLVDGQCCYVVYQIENTNHAACLRTNEYQKKNDTVPEEIKNLIKKINEGYGVISANCRGKYLKYYFNLVFIFLIFLI